MDRLPDADRDLALASMDDGVILFRADGSLGLANLAAERLLGPATRGVAGLTPASFQDAVREAGDAPRQFDLEVGFPPRQVRCTIRRVGDDGSVLVVARDVTDALRLDRTRRDFVANASHELKTPVATIRATAETLAIAAQDDPAAVARFANRIEEEAIRLADIVSDLLDLSRLEGGSDRHDEVRLDLVLTDEAARLADAAAGAGVALALEAEPVPVLPGSERDLELMVRNLLDNALRYSESGGAVRASTCLDGDEIILRVEDEGVGIPSRDLPRIFERFYRVDRGRSRETGGTGLGLAIVRHVAENHGAEVHIESELGRGTSVEVRFPLGTMSS